MERNLGESDTFSANLEEMDASISFLHLCRVICGKSVELEQHFVRRMKFANFLQFDARDCFHSVEVFML